VRRLLEYEQIKLAALQLGATAAGGPRHQRPSLTVEQSLVPVLPEVDAHDLQRAWLDVLRRAKLTQHHRIGREELSVREHMSAILRTAAVARFVEFGGAVRGPGGVPMHRGHFRALLELAKETLIEITQAEPFAPIYVRLAYRRPEPLRHPTLRVFT
jgi:segregation and condensation protein A